MARGILPYRGMSRIPAASTELHTVAMKSKRSTAPMGRQETLLLPISLCKIE